MPAAGMPAGGTLTPAVARCPAPVAGFATPRASPPPDLAKVRPPAYHDRRTMEERHHKDTRGRSLRAIGVALAVLVHAMSAPLHLDHEEHLGAPRADGSRDLPLAILEWGGGAGGPHEPHSEHDHLIRADLAAAMGTGSLAWIAATFELAVDAERACAPDHEAAPAPPFEPPRAPRIPPSRAPSSPRSPPSA